MATWQRPPLLAETTSYERWNAKNESQRNPDFRRTHLIQLNAVAAPNKRLKIDKISSFVETVHTRPEAQQQVGCGQTAGWIKMRLGTEVNLGPGDVVLDGVSAAPPKRGRAPSFWPLSVVATVAHLSCCCALVVTFCINQ